MAQNAQEFWSEVKGVRLQVTAEIHASPHQPQDGTCWITSLRNRTANTTAGDTVQATIALAGQRIVEGTHRLSTAEEVDDLIARHEKRAEDIADAEIKKNTKHFVTHNPPTPKSKRAAADKDAN